MKFTKDQIEHSVNTGWLALDHRDKLRYITGGSGRLLFFVVSPVALFVLLTGIQISFWLIALACASFIALAFAIISLLKLLDLRLLRTETKLPEGQIREMIAIFAQLKKWKVSNNRKSLIILKTGPGRSGATGWGERITMITKGSEVWISSISDPDRPMSFRSYRRNKYNIGFIRDVLAGRRVPATTLGHESVSVGITSVADGD